MRQEKNRIGDVRVDDKELEKRTFEELSAEFLYHFPHVARVIELVPILYDNLTLTNKLSHNEAMEKIKLLVKKAENQWGLKGRSGLSSRNIYRYLPEDNPNVPHRDRKKSATVSSKAHSVKDVVITEDAWIDPKEPNVIQDKYNVIVVQDRAERKVEKMRLESEKYKAKLSHRLELEFAFFEGRVYNAIENELPQEMKCDNYADFKNIWRAKGNDIYSFMFKSRCAKLQEDATRLMDELALMGQEAKDVQSKLLLLS